VLPLQHQCTALWCASHVAHPQCLSPHPYPLWSYTFECVRRVLHSPLPRHHDGDQLEMSGLTCPPALSRVSRRVLWGARTSLDGDQGYRHRGTGGGKVGHASSRRTKAEGQVEEGSSVSHGVRQRKKEVWGQNRRRQGEEKSLDVQVSWCYLPSVSTPE